MFVFDPEQMDVLAARTVARFEDRLLRHLLPLFPEQLAPPPAATGDAAAPPADPPASLQRLRLALERGRQLGFGTFPELTAFVALALVNARDSTPGEPPLLGWARSILEHREADATAKLELIDHELARRALTDERTAAARVALASARQVAA